MQTERMEQKQFANATDCKTPTQFPNRDVRASHHRNEIPGINSEQEIYLYIN